MFNAGLTTIKNASYAYTPDHNLRERLTPFSLADATPYQARLLPSKDKPLLCISRKATLLAYLARNMLVKHIFIVTDFLMRNKTFFDYNFKERFFIF